MPIIDLGVRGLINSTLAGAFPAARTVTGVAKMIDSGYVAISTARLTCVTSRVKLEAAIRGIPQVENLRDSGVAVVLRVRLLPLLKPWMRFSPDCIGECAALLRAYLYQLHH